ncbi:hypothetical protein [Mycobacterium sp.]|uniref:hypothetical protein n=1 Tax=Mycobacterium sp. TaxID=1785 RepID=UPI001281A55B|nr:hypothetical protein [Mycobacterium sp.]KAA8956428.1 MAG: hypothetical protein F6Q13_16795 [Mycobacterium sp.]
MTTVSCSRRTPDRRRRRKAATGANAAIVIGGAIAAAMTCTGIASADSLVPVPAADEDPFLQLVQTIDPDAFNAAGDPTDFIGITASQINTDLADTVFGPELNTIAGQILAGDFLASSPTDVDAFQILVQTFVNPDAFNAAGDPTDFIGIIASQLDSLLADTVYGPELDTIADQIITAFGAVVP